MKDDRLSLDQTIHSDALWHPQSRERERLTEIDKERQREGEKRQSQTVLDVTRLVMLWWITGKALKQNAYFTHQSVLWETGHNIRNGLKKKKHSHKDYTPTPPSHSIHLKTSMQSAPAYAANSLYSLAKK